MKLAEFFISSTKLIFAKLLKVSESSIRLGHIWHFSYFNLLQELFASNNFYMETRLCNIFKTANAITLRKTILESPYEELQGL